MALQGVVLLALGVNRWAVEVVDPHPLLGGPRVGPFAFVVACCFLCFWVRDETYKANWVQDSITPRGYFRAHLYAGLVLAAGLFAGFGLGFPYDVQMSSTLVYFLLMISMFPDGKAMQDHPIRL